MVKHTHAYNIKQKVHAGRRLPARLVTKQQQLNPVLSEKQRRTLGVKDTQRGAI